MATKLAPLLCELHAHTTWSDGVLSVRELVRPLRPRRLRRARGHRPHDAHRHRGDRRRRTSTRYLARSSAEAERARRALRPARPARARADLRGSGPDPAGPRGRRRSAPLRRPRRRPRICSCRRARAGGGARRRPPVSAGGRSPARLRGTAAFAAEPASWRRSSTGSSSSTARRCSAGSPRRACRPSRAATSTSSRTSRTWKTLLPCAKDEEAVVDYLRSPRPAFLVTARPSRRAARRRQPDRRLRQMSQSGDEVRSNS